jgi:recombination protein RecA
MGNSVAASFELTPWQHPQIIYSTGSLQLDIALGIGGIPGGTIVEFDGPEASGKTTLAYHLIAEAQKSERICALIDSDCGFNADFARRCGVNVEQLYLSQPGHAEQAFDILETLAATGVFSIVALDSFNALVPYHELFKSLNGSIYKNNSDPLLTDLELLASSLRRLSSSLRRTGTSVLFTNQTDRRMSTIYHQLAAHPARLALKLNASICLRLSPLSNLVSGGKVIGARIRARVIKNKFSPCLQPIDFDIIHHQGIDKTGEMLNLGVHCKLVLHKNNGIYFQSERLGKTSSEAKRFLNQNIIVRDDIEKAIRQVLIPDNHNAAI